MALPIEALDKEELSRSRLETLSIIQELIIKKISMKSYALTRRFRVKIVKSH